MTRPRLTLVATLAIAMALLAPATHATADPSANDWYRLRQCESSNNYSINTGNAHYGAYQFDLATWRSVGGSGYPYRASKAEQDARALILYRKRGWQPWQCASILGLREDSDARSGRTSDIHIGTAPTTPTVPPFLGGSHYYVYGDRYYQIKQFQAQMHRRGFFPAGGTGAFGLTTLAVVKRLQLLNGLSGTGRIGPLTWPLAWKGVYSAPPTTTPTSPVVPPFLGVTHWYRFGDRYYQIKQFQDQMHKRGFFPPGTGQFGPKTLAMVKQLQRLNGLMPTGYIGPKTWRTAWTGRYVMP